jgi:tyrosyl-tRNA synthetase
MIGDPSGRSQERNLLDQQTLDDNVAAIKAQISSILVLDGPSGRLVDNRSWTEGVSLLDFLRDVGKHATVNTMIARESVKKRMEGEDGISFTEFSYMLLQANDYRELSDQEGCELQVGGSDQWGNILAGVDLIRRSRQRVVHALSWPLITAPDGSKLGKTTGARVWLDPARTSPYQFFQHWMHTEDAQVAEFLAKFTFLALADIAAVVEAHEAAPERQEAQRTLAREVTTIVHGADAAMGAEEASAALFGGRVDQLSAASLAVLLGEMPVHEMGRADLEALDIADAFVASGLASSKGEARRLVAQGGASINGERVTEGRILAASDLLHGHTVVLRKGKRDYAALTCP